MSTETLTKHKLVPLIPDGGWGWAVIAGSFFIHVFSDGFVYSLGVVADVLLKVCISTFLVSKSCDKRE